MPGLSPTLSSILRGAYKRRGEVRVKVDLVDDVLHRVLLYLYICSYTHTMFGCAWYLKGTNTSQQPLRCSQIIRAACEAFSGTGH